MSMMNRMILAGLGMLVGGTLALPVSAENALLYKNGRSVTGTSVLWRETSQDYLVMNGDTSITVPLAEVARVVVDTPAEYDQAVGMMKGRLYAQAIPLLEGIVKKYRRLNWDLEALKLLAQAYLESNNPKKGVAAMETLYASVPHSEVSLPLQMLYWKALSATGANETLQKELGIALGVAPVDMLGTLYLMRGNMFLKAGEDDAALADFLKVTTLLQKNKAVQPEALFRASELLDKARDPRGADLRKALQRDYPGNEFAAKASSKPAVQPVAEPETKAGDKAKAKPAPAKAP
jgi:tetratricopeptide (TPR) repeat protein